MTNTFYTDILTVVHNVKIKKRKFYAPKDDFTNHDLSKINRSMTKTIQTNNNQP